MFCSKCGTNLSQEAKFCTKCGSLINTNNVNTNSSKPRTILLGHKKLISIIFIAIIILLASLIPFLNSSSDSGRTILIYMVGSNLESENASAVTDISEMLDSNADFSKNTVLIYTGGSKTWNDYDIPSDKNVIYKLTNNGLEKLQEYDKKNMTTPATLTEFLNYGYNNYKAKNYDLILWDHGGGPIYGYGSDENFPIKMMSITDLEQALKNSPFEKEKLELLGFDACLMSSIEIGHALSPYAKYLISSQEVIPGDGWNYAYLKELDNNLNTLNFAKKIIDSFYSYYEQFNYKGGVGLSLIDTSKINDLQDEISNLFSSIDNNIDLEFNNLSFARASSKSYGKADKQVFDLVDLKDLVEHLPTEYTKSNLIKTLTNEVILYQKTDITGSCGVSIYFPYYNVNNIQVTFNKYKKLNFNQAYVNFIKTYISKLTGTPVKVPTISDVKAQINENNVSVILPSDIINNASAYNYLIFEKIDDEYFTPIYKGYDVDVDKDSNTVSTSIDKKVIYVSDYDETDLSQVNEMNIMAVGQSSTNGGINYYIKGMVQKWDDGDTVLDNFQAKAVFLEYFVSNSGQTTIGNVIPVSSNINNEYYASKESYDLSEWKSFAVTNSSQKILDTNGNYTLDWKLGTIMGLEWTDFEKSQDNIKIELKPLDNNKEYYIVFQVFDSNNNNYSTNIAEFPS